MKKDELTVCESFPAIQGEGKTIGKPVQFLRLSYCNVACPWCFVGNTFITTENNGYVKIKDIKKGESLLTLDESEGTIVKTIVDEVLIREVDTSEIIKIETSSTNMNKLFVTKNHPIFVKHKGFIPAEEIKVGDIILGLDSKQLIQWRMNHHNPVHNVDINLLKERCKKTFTGRKVSDEQRKKISDYKKKHNPMKDPSVVKKNMMSHFYHKSSLEGKYSELFEQNNLPITYVGNNKLVLGNKTVGHRCPDFLVDGKQKIIEVYDTTFPFYTGDGYRGSSYEERRTTFYNDLGYDVIFLTEKDLIDSEKLIHKLFEYCFNGEKVISVKSKLTSHEYVRLFGSLSTKKTKVYNLSCSPYNTYLANRLFVHNCDTKYYNEGTVKSVDEVIRDLDRSGMKDIVITGGEPMLQKENIFRLMGKADSYRYHLETNGTIYDYRMKFFDTIACSPKRFGAPVPRDVSLKLAELDNITYKFVYEPGLEPWWEDYITKYGIKKENVYIMPLGSTRIEQEQNMPEVIEYAIKNKFNFSPRIQVLAYNTKRGV